MFTLSSHSDDDEDLIKISGDTILVYLNIISDNLLEELDPMNVMSRGIICSYTNYFPKMTMFVIDGNDSYCNSRDFQIGDDIPFILKTGFSIENLDYKLFFKELVKVNNPYLDLFDDQICFLLYGQSIIDMIRLTKICLNDILLVDSWELLEEYDPERHKAIIFANLTFNVKPKHILNFTSDRNRKHWQYQTVINNNTKFIFLNQTLNQPFDKLDYVGQSFKVINLSTPLPFIKHKFVTI